MNPFVEGVLPQGKRVCDYLVAGLTRERMFRMARSGGRVLVLSAYVNSDGEMCYQTPHYIGTRAKWPEYRKPRKVKTVKYRVIVTPKGGRA